MMMKTEGNNIDNDDNKPWCLGPQCKQFDNDDDNNDDYDDGKDDGLNIDNISNDDDNDDLNLNASVLWW